MTFRNIRSILFVGPALLALLFASSWPVQAEDPALDGASNPKAKQVSLDSQQHNVAAKHNRFAKSLKQLAQISKKDNPEQTDLLYRAIQQNGQAGISAEMKEIAALLSKESYGDAEVLQKEVIQELDELIKILESQDYRKSLEQRIKDLEKIIKDVEKARKKQTETRWDIEKGKNLDKAAKKQGKNLGKTNQIAKAMDKFQKGDKKPGEGKPGEGKPGEGKPGEGKPGEGKPGEGKPGEGKPGEGKPGEGKPGEGKPGEGKPGEGKPGEGKPGEGKPGEGKPGEGKPGEGKPGEGKPGEGKPGEGKPGEGKPGEGKPGEGKPGEGKPGEGKPGEGKPGKGKPGKGKPGESEDQMPGRKNVQNAIEKMEQAIEELKKKSKDAASDKQDEIISELQKAEEKLRELLRQLREEERMLFLADLQSRFRKMLSKEKKIEKETKQLAKISVENRTSAHTQRTTRLSRTQSDIALDAQKALLILREEGSSITFPVVVEAMYEDMVNVSGMLKRGSVDDLTLSIEDDIIQTLREMIDALQKEMDEKEDEKESKPKKGKPQDPKLVEDLAELKLLRAMQKRINGRTKRCSRLIDGSQAKDVEVVRLLEELSERQDRVRKATYDIHTGKGK